MTIVIKCRKCGYVFYHSKKQSNLDYLIVKHGRIADFIRRHVHYRFANRCPRCGRKLNPHAIIVINNKIILITEILKGREYEKVLHIIR